jgi:hypothetical protein
MNRTAKETLGSTHSHWANQSIAGAVFCLGLLLVAAPSIAESPLQLPRPILGDNRPVLILGGVESPSSSLQVNGQALEEANPRVAPPDPGSPSAASELERRRDAQGQASPERLELALRKLVQRLAESNRELQEANLAKEQLEKRITELEHRSRVLEERAKTPLLSVAASEPELTDRPKSTDKAKTQAKTIAELQAAVEDLRQTVRQHRATGDQMRQEARRQQVEAKQRQEQRRKAGRPRAEHRRKADDDRATRRAPRPAESEDDDKDVN